MRVMKRQFTFSIIYGHPQIIYFIIKTNIIHPDNFLYATTYSTLDHDCGKLKET